LEEVVGMLMEDGEPALKAQFVGTQLIQIARDIGTTAEALVGHR
jgi:hypothetical protein